MLEWIVKPDRTIGASRMFMRSLLAGTALAIAAAWHVLPAAAAADTSAAERPLPRHPDDLGADNEHLLGMREPYTLVLLLGGLLATLILVRGPALRRAEQTEKRLPGDAR
jgi:hypothetical protein